MRQAGATLHRGARASHYRGLSCCGAQAPDAQAQQLWLTGLVAPWHVGSSQTRARTRVPCIGRQILNHCATREAQQSLILQMRKQRPMEKCLALCYTMSWGQGYTSSLDLPDSRPSAISLLLRIRYRPLSESVAASGCSLVISIITALPQSGSFLCTTHVLRYLPKVNKTKYLTHSFRT